MFRKKILLHIQKRLFTMGIYQVLTWGGTVLHILVHQHVEVKAGSAFQMYVETILLQ